MDIKLDFIKLFSRSNFFSFKFVMSIFWQFFFLQLSLSLHFFS